MGTPIVQMVREGHPPVTHDQAKASAQRLINSHFNNREERARVSIPVRHDDDDVVVLAYINEQRAQLARAEKVIEDIKKALDLDGSAHARHNLDGAYIDLERQGADKICLKTLRRVRNQLGEIEQTLAEYDRPSAPLDGALKQEGG